MEKDFFTISNLAYLIAKLPNGQCCWYKYYFLNFNWYYSMQIKTHFNSFADKVPWTCWIHCGGKNHEGTGRERERVAVERCNNRQQRTSHRAEREREMRALWVAVGGFELQKIGAQKSRKNGRTSFVWVVRGSVYCYVCKNEVQKWVKFRLSRWAKISCLKRNCNFYSY